MIRHITLDFKPEDKEGRTDNDWAVDVMRRLPDLESVQSLADIANGWAQFRGDAAGDW